METLQRLYTDWLNRPTLVLIVSGVLFTVGMLASGLRSDISIADDLRMLSGYGDLLFGFYLSALLIMVYIGWKYDDQPGRITLVALIAAFVGTMINWLFSLAVSGGWLPAWAGLQLGIFMAALYGAWRVQARFALVTILMIVYTLLVTTGLILAIDAALSASTLVGLTAIGGFAFALACVVCHRIRANVLAARREALDGHIRDGATRSVRTVLLWGGTTILLALPAVGMGTGPIRSLGILLFTGVIISTFAVLAYPALLALLVRAPVEAQDPERGGRRESRKRK